MWLEKEANAKLAKNDRGLVTVCALQLLQLLFGQIKDGAHFVTSVDCSHNHETMFKISDSFSVKKNAAIMFVFTAR